MTFIILFFLITQILTSSIKNSQFSSLHLTNYLESGIQNLNLNSEIQFNLKTIHTLYSIKRPIFLGQHNYELQINMKDDVEETVVQILSFLEKKFNFKIKQLKTSLIEKGRNIISMRINFTVGFLRRKMINKEKKRKSYNRIKFLEKIHNQIVKIQKKYQIQQLLDGLDLPSKTSIIISQRFNSKSLSQDLSPRFRSNWLLQGLSNVTVPVNNSVEYIKNGNFSNTTCKYEICIWDIKNWQPQFLPYWNPQPEIEIGAAYRYINGFGSRWIIQLTSNVPTCIWQLVPNLSAGFYELTYMYNSRASIPLELTNFFIYVNNTLMRETIPQNYSANVDKVSNLVIVQDNDSMVIKFCGSPSGWGAIILQVSLKQTAIFVPSSDLGNNTNTSSLSQSNTTNNTPVNSQVNTTNIRNQTNQTSTNYSHQNSSLNTTKKQDQTNETITNQTINVQTKQLIQIQPEKQQSQIILSDFVNKSLSLVISNGAISSTIQIPVARQILTKYFSFLLQLDHLWLYIYHKRNYGAHFITIMRAIQQFQETKWDFMQKFVHSTTGDSLDFSYIKQQFNNKVQDTPQSFYLIQENPRSFMSINFKFILINLPLILVIFLIGSFMFKFLSRFKLQSAFQKFSLKSSLIIMIFQGNVQSFSYFLLSDLVTLCHRIQSTKIMNFGSILFFFILLIFLISTPFILRQIHKNDKKAQYYEKTLNSLSGATYFMVEFGLLNILLGSAHILCESRPFTQLILLALIESAFIIYTLSGFRRKLKIYVSKFHIWIGVMASFLRLLLIYTNYLFETSSGILKFELQDIQLILIVFYLGLWILCVIHSLISQIKNISQFLVQKLYRLLDLKKLVKDQLNAEAKIIEKKMKTKFISQASCMKKIIRIRIEDYQAKINEDDKEEKKKEKLQMIDLGALNKNCFNERKLKLAKKRGKYF